MAPREASGKPQRARSDRPLTGRQLSPGYGGAISTVEPNTVTGDGSFMGWPQSRWTYNHIDELVPTKSVWRGSGAAIDLPCALRPLGDLIIETAAGSLTWDEALSSTDTDGLLVLHHGNIVFEEYFGEAGPHVRHLTMSCNKSVIGTIAERLIDERVIDRDALVPTILPELRRRLGPMRQCVTCSTCGSGLNITRTTPT
jgi:hypothetical protein